MASGVSLLLLLPLIDLLPPLFVPPPSLPRPADALIERLKDEDCDRAPRDLLRPCDTCFVFCGTGCKY